VRKYHNKDIQRGNTTKKIYREGTPQYNIQRGNTTIKYTARKYHNKIYSKEILKICSEGTPCSKIYSEEIPQ
jgi:hypothetical protein